MLIENKWVKSNKFARVNSSSKVLSFFRLIKIAVRVISVLASIQMWMSWESAHIIIIIKCLLNIKPDQNIFCSSWQAVRRYAMEGGRGEEGGERSDEGGDEGEEEDAADRWYSKVRLRAAVLCFLWHLAGTNIKMTFLSVSRHTDDFTDKTLASEDTLKMKMNWINKKWK